MKKVACVALFVILTLASTICFAAYTDISGYWEIKFDNGSSGWLQLVPATGSNARVVNGVVIHYQGKIKIPACSGDIVVAAGEIGQKIGAFPGWCVGYPGIGYNVLNGTIASPTVISDGIIRTLGGANPDLTFTMFKR